MLLIVAHHYVVNSGIWEIIRSSPAESDSLFYFFLGMWGKTGINCFVLITGWFMCTSRISVRKFLKLLLEIEFYKVVIGIVFLVSGKESFSTDWLLGLLPIRNIKDGFVSCFLVFYLFIPFMNILIRNMDQKMHLILVGMLLFIYTVLGTIPACSITMNYVSWFCTLYFIASYLRIYEFPMKNSRAFSWLWLSMGTLLLSMLSVWAIAYSGKSVSPYWFVSDANKLMALVTSLCLFNLFKSIRLPYNKLINSVAATTFGVLLIHAHSDTMRQWLWYDLFDNAGHFSPFSPFNAILIVLLVFVACSCIDCIRIHLFEEPLFSWLDKHYFVVKESKQ